MALHILVYDTYMFNTVSPHKAVSSLRSCGNKQFHPNEKKAKVISIQSSLEQGSRQPSLVFGRNSNAGKGRGKAL